MLVPTVGSMHKVTFAHPAQLEGGLEGGLASVLAEAGVGGGREQQHTIAWPSSTILPSFACSHLTQVGETFTFTSSSTCTSTSTCRRRRRCLCWVTQLAS